MLPLLNMNMEAAATAAAPPPQSSSSKKQQQQQVMRTVSISILVMSLPVLYVSFLHVPPAALFRDTTFWFLMSNSIIIVIAADSGMLFFRSSSSDGDVDVGSLPFVVSAAGGEPAAAVVRNGHHAPSGVSASGEVEVIENQALVGDLKAVATESDHDAYALVVTEDHVASAAASRELVVSPSADAGEAAVATENGDGAIVPARPRRPMATASRSLGREDRPATTRRRHGHGHRPSRSSHALVPVQDKSVVVSEDKRLRRTATERRRPSPAAAAEENKESEYARLSDEELNRRVEEFIARFNREIRLQLEKEQAAAA